MNKQEFKRLHRVMRLVQHDSWQLPLPRVLLDVPAKSYDMLIKAWPNEDMLALTWPGSPARRKAFSMQPRLPA